MSDRTELQGKNGLVKFGAIWAAAMSALLAIWLVVRASVDLNPLNFATLVLATAAAVIAIWRSTSLTALIISDVLLFLAMVPALIGGVGFLYLPALVLLIAGTVRVGRRAQVRSSQA